SDQDGVGDACDDKTCTETAVNDPRAVGTVIAAKNAGKLSAKFMITLPSGYSGEPVTVRLDDTDSHPIARQEIGGLPVKKAGTLWLYKVRALGLQKVHLKAMGPTQPGLFRVGVRAKGWFTAAAANQ